MSPLHEIRCAIVRCGKKLKKIDITVRLLISYFYCNGAERQDWTADTGIFSPLLYHWATSARYFVSLGPVGFEPTTSGLKGHCSTGWAIDPHPDYFPCHKKLQAKESLSISPSIASENTQIRLDAAPEIHTVLVFIITSRTLWHRLLPILLRSARTFSTAFSSSETCLRKSLRRDLPTKKSSLSSSQDLSTRSRTKMMMASILRAHMLTGTTTGITIITITAKGKTDKGVIAEKAAHVEMAAAETRDITITNTPRIFLVSFS